MSLATQLHVNQTKLIAGGSKSHRGCSKDTFLPITIKSITLIITGRNKTSWKPLSLSCLPDGSEP